MQIAVVTGCSTGIGYATALRLAKEGYRVYAGVRSDVSGAALKAAAEDLLLSLLLMDVDDDESVAAAIGSVIESEGRVDVLVNNAGVGAFGDIEATPLSRFTETMNTNAWSVLRCTQAVLPTMRAQRSGCIVTNTSLSGRITSPGFGPYCVSKWAAEAMCEMLAIEVAGFDIRVAIIEPGVVATPIFEKAAEIPPNPDSPYLEIGDRTGRVLLTQLMTDPATPDHTAEVIYHAITTDQPTLRYLVGSDAESWTQSRRNLTDEQWVTQWSTPDDDQWRANVQAWTGIAVPPLEP